MKILLNDVILACGGSFTGAERNKEIKGISTDTRDNLNGKLYIPLKGSRYDGHTFIKEALQKGAVAVLTEKSIDEPMAVFVNSTHQALADLAAWHRSRFKIPVIAITGSAGKTTTKDITASILAQRYNILKTDGNKNNEIGLPLTMLELTNQDAVVVEMGMNHLGEIHRLSSIAKPDICVITNIGDAHIGNLQNRANILKAKTEIFDHMNSNGIGILNGDDSLLLTLKTREKFRGKKILFYGMTNQKTDILAQIEKKASDKIIGSQIKILSKNQFGIKWDFNISISQPGRYMVYDTLAAISVALYLNMTPEEIQKGIDDVTLSKNRGEIIKTPNFKIINDTYNANPLSVEAAIDAFSQMADGQRKVAVLGDMLELGAQAAKLHENIGKYINQSNVELLICVGSLSKNTLAGFMTDKSKNGVWFENKEECAKYIKNFLKPNDIILVKGSRGMALETLVKQLTQTSSKAGS